MQHLPFANGTYDFVFASHVLEHVPNDAKALSEIRRILRPKGIAILPVPIVGEKQSSIWNLIPMNTITYVHLGLITLICMKAIFQQWKDLVRTHYHNNINCLCTKIEANGQGKKVFSGLRWRVKSILMLFLYVMSEELLKANGVSNP